MPAAGGTAEKMALPPGYALAPNPLSPAAVNRDGRILLQVQKLGLTFFQAGIYDPVRRTLADVPAPYQTGVNSAGWGLDGNIELQITHWSSTLWRYRPESKNKQADNSIRSITIPSWE